MLEERVSALEQKIREIMLKLNPPPEPSPAPSEDQDAEKEEC